MIHTLLPNVSGAMVTGRYSPGPVCWGVKRSTVNVPPVMEMEKFVLKAHLHLATVEDVGVTVKKMALVMRAGGLALFPTKILIATELLFNKL